jgi:hypothetical protein
MTARRKRPDPKRQLLVEGADDEHVVYALMERYRFEPEFQVRDLRGISLLLQTIPVLIKTDRNLEQLGIIVDADRDVGARWQSVVVALEEAGYRGLPGHPEAVGCIVEQAGLPRVGIWVMPDNQRPGALEDYLRLLVPPADLYVSIAESTVDALPASPSRFADHHRVKAVVHTWLAWQSDPGTPLGFAITKKYLQPDGPHTDALLHWLQRLFTPDATPPTTPPTP